MSVPWGAIAQMASSAIAEYSKLKNIESGVYQPEEEKKVDNSSFRREEVPSQYLENPLMYAPETYQMAEGLLDKNARTRGVGEDVLDAAKRTPGGLNPIFNERLNEMIGAAKESGYDVSIGSGFRSKQRQKELWEGPGARKYPNPKVRAKYYARPGGSSHGYGFAADLKYGPGAQSWTRKNMGNYGLYNRMNYPGEYHHVEPTDYHPSMKYDYTFK